MVNPKASTNREDKASTKKRKRSLSDDLKKICNVTGFDDGPSNQDEMACLEEMAADLIGTASTVETNPSNEGEGEGPEPPGLDRIPNLKVELSRHLQIESLSRILLQSCTGLRMPTFERWLIDSKLEERDRYESILTQWMEDPSLTQQDRKKKKFGRAAVVEAQTRGNDIVEKEQLRREKESKLLSDVHLFQSRIYRGNRRALIHEIICHASIDPILPSHPLESDPSSIRLAAEIAHAGYDPVEVVRELFSTTKDAAMNLIRMRSRLGGWTGKTDRIRVEHEDRKVCLIREDKGSGRETKPFVTRLNASHYRKLRKMYDSMYPSSTGRNREATRLVHAFHAVLFAMLIRYSSLSGGHQLNDLRGGGMQGAIHENVFDCLRKWFGPNGTECFASPFNCTLSRYYSAFSSPDIDGHFGSLGDFFGPCPSSKFLMDGGWYEVNPPFSPGVMDRMIRRIDELLDEAAERRLESNFIVIVPTCQNNETRELTGKHYVASKKQSYKDNTSNDTKADEVTMTAISSVHLSALNSFQRLIGNPRCLSHTILPAREHGYVEGSQHLRPTRYKESQYSTSVVVLGNGPPNWDGKLFEKDLREAFASRHGREMEERKGDDGNVLVEKQM